MQSDYEYPPNSADKKIGSSVKFKEESASQIIKKNTVLVEKNQIDMTVGITYGLGCSLLHLSLLFSQFWVKGVDLDRAKAIDRRLIK